MLLLWYRCEISQHVNDLLNTDLNQHVHLLVLWLCQRNEGTTLLVTATCMGKALVIS